MEETLNELAAIRKSLGLDDYDAKARIPTIIGNKPVKNPVPAKPKRRAPAPIKPPVRKRKPVHRQPIISRGKVDRAAQAKLTRKPGSKINPKSILTPKEWLDSGRWVGVVSSNVRAIRYDKNRYELLVRFKSGAEYKYSGIDRSLARRFFNASSSGKWVWRNLRWANRPYQRVK